ncbi:MAG: hypothetical protein ACI8S6_005181 [Myxococcota bacterium]|jgi:hypothetical protein
MLAALISSVVLFILAAGVLAFRAWSAEHRGEPVPLEEPEPDNIISLEQWRAARDVTLPPVSRAE